MTQQINPDETQFNTPSYPFSLEGHWQPWYDDRRDYNTNAPSYYDYLSNFNGLQKSIVELLNKVARQDVEVEDTNSITLTKTGDWQEDSDETVLSADIKVSSLAQNDLVVKSDGVYAHTDLSQVEQAINELQAKAIMNTWYTDDFNTLTKHGLYKQKYRPKNAPKHLYNRFARVHEDVWFAIVLSNDRSDIVCTQIAVSAGTPVDMYMRHYENDEWTEWLLISSGLETEWPTQSANDLTVHGVYKPKYQPVNVPTHYKNTGKHDEIWSVISLSNNKEDLTDLVNTQIAVNAGENQDIWTRYIYQGNWSNWRKLAMDVESDWYTDDFNSLTVNGVYKPKYKPLNAPTGIVDDEGKEHPNIWSVIVMSNNKSGNDLVCTQLAITGGGGKAIYFRYVYNGEWREWKKVTTDYDFETKEQVIESSLNTLDITHGANGTSETTKVDVNTQQVLLHDNLLTGSSITKVHNPGTNTTTIGISASYTKRVEDLESGLREANETIATLETSLEGLTQRVQALEQAQTS